MSSLFYFHQLERLIILFSFLLSVERYDYAKKLTAVISDLYKVSNLESINYVYYLPLMIMNINYYIYICYWSNLY